MRIFNYTILSSVLLFAGFSASAEIIESNMLLNFHERESLANSIDKTLFLNPTQATQRLVNERLGTWLGTQIALTAEHRITLAVNDPGTTPAPTEIRELIRVDSNAQIDGSLIGGIASSAYNSSPKIWTCAAGFTQCTEAGTASYPLSAPKSSFDSSSQALGGLHLSATAAKFETLFPGVTPRLGPVTPPPTAILTPTVSYHEIQGSLQLRASYQTKSLEQYLDDALQASAASASTWSNWLSAANNDVAQLRSANYQSFFAQAGTMPVAGVTELREAQTVLAYARDAAYLQALDATPGGNMNTNSRTVTQL